MKQNNSFNLTVINTNTSGVVTVKEKLSSNNLTSGMPFIPGTTVGTNLVSGTAYWIQNVINDFSFTASSTPPTSYTPVVLTNTAVVTAGSFVVGVSYIIITAGTTDFTLVGATSNAIGTTFVATGVGSGTGTVVASSTSLSTLSVRLLVGSGYDQPYGVVGGDVVVPGTQIQCRVKIGANAEANGWIIRQKGARKFLVTDGTNIGQCSLVDLANGTLTDDTMTITVTDAGASTYRLAKLGDAFGITFAGQGYILTFGAASATPPAGSLYPVVTVASL